MNNVVKNILVASAAFAVGAAAGWYAYGKKLDKLAEDMDNKVDLDPELNDLINDILYAEEIDDVDPVPEEEKNHKRSGRYPWTENETYSEKIRDLGYFENLEQEYIKHSEKKEEPKVAVPVSANSDLEYTDGYNIQYLTYFSDGILADDEGEVVSDELIARFDLLLRPIETGAKKEIVISDHIDKIDYDIIADNRKYSDTFDDDLEDEE